MIKKAYLKECDFDTREPGAFGSRNLWPIINEASVGASLKTAKSYSSKDKVVDELTGRVYTSDFPEKIGSVYGETGRLNDYCSNDVGISLSAEKVHNYLRVPFRKIPMFEIDSISELESIHSQYSTGNESYTYLWRGQTNLYETQRDPAELRLLYGNTGVFEPSFLPSFLRNDLSYGFVQSIWLNLLEVLLNDLRVDYNNSNETEKLKKLNEELLQIKFTPQNHTLALALAQHYGLPSVGMDLTDSPEIAAWFACNKISVSDSGQASTTSVLGRSDCSPTVFIFRMPKNCILEYSSMKPKHFPRSRPDCQNAWFAHVGWGQAKNQLANYLCFAFKLSEKFILTTRLPQTHSLFPKMEEDLLLANYLNLRANTSFASEVRDVLKGIYHFE